jgi:hypothetical protein
MDKRVRIAWIFLVHVTVVLRRATPKRTGNNRNLAWALNHGKLEYRFIEITPGGGLDPEHSITPMRMVNLQMRFL